MLLIFGIFALFGYSYINDICEQKGRKHRKVFDSSLPTHYEKCKIQKDFVNRRLAAHDENYERFTHKKERAAVHH